MPWKETTKMELKLNLLLNRELKSTLILNYVRFGVIDKMVDKNR